MFVHLILVILLWNSPKFAKYFPARALSVSPNDWQKQKDLTYLELPPDAQKLTQRPKSNIISDKDRKAMSRTPHLDAEGVAQNPRQLTPWTERASAAPGNGGSGPARGRASPTRAAGPTAIPAGAEADPNQMAQAQDRRFRPRARTSIPDR